MKVLFRADASLKIGSGHIMRCLTLARALKKEGADCEFICRDLDGNLVDFVRSEFLVHKLPAEEADQNNPIDIPDVYQEWLGVEISVDAEQTSEILMDVKPDWLVVDHYALNAEWELTANGRKAKILAIDDLANRSHVADILLDQNFGRSKRDYLDLVPPHCQLFIGPEYALLRDEFPAWRERSLMRRADAEVRRILVSMGGIDIGNVTSLVLDELAAVSFEHPPQVVVVMGAKAPWIDDVRARAEAHPLTVDVLTGIDNMAEYLASTDMAIGAAGSSTWERCCLGVPTISIVLAENQLSGAEALQRAGISMVLLDVQQVAGKLAQLIGDLAASPSELQRLTALSMTLTDGLGAERVARALL